MLHRLLGPTARVACHHHQALQRIAPGPDAVHVAEDGVVEAVEAAGPPVLHRGAVASRGDREDLRLFEALVGAAD